MTIQRGSEDKPAAIERCLPEVPQNVCSNMSVLLLACVSPNEYHQHIFVSTDVEVIFELLNPTDFQGLVGGLGPICGGPRSGRGLLTFRSWIICWDRLW